MVLIQEDKSAYRGHRTATERGKHLKSLDPLLELPNKLYNEPEVIDSLFREMLFTTIAWYSNTNKNNISVYVKSLLNILNNREIQTQVKQFILGNPIDVSTRINYCLWVLRLLNKLKNDNINPLLIDDFVAYLSQEFCERPDKIINWEEHLAHSDNEQEEENTL